MSYLVLARKYRPQTFHDVVGQEPVVRILRNGLRRDRVPHAMLFSGVRGVGKTTLARIMAKALNCESDSDDIPCDTCQSCLEIRQGSAVDLKEIDGASNRGIQEIRELKENIRFFPLRSKFKIIIIDEVHMLTTEAFNALLKTLEEPPEHVYFMFATTEIHKVPITILSRCQRYELKRVGFTGLADFFSSIAKSEEVTISAAGIDMIVREADGSVRDGLSLLDQMFAFGGDDGDGRIIVRDEDVVQVLGLVDHQVFVKLATAVLDSDLTTCLQVLEETYLLGIDLKRFAADLLSFFRGLVVCKTVQDPSVLLDVAETDVLAMSRLAAAHSKESLYQLFQVFMKGMQELQYASRPRLTLEMLFVRATQVGQVVPAQDIAARLAMFLEEHGTPAAGQTSPAQKKTVTSRVEPEVVPRPPAVEPATEMVVPPPVVQKESPPPMPEPPPPVVEREELAAVEPLVAAEPTVVQKAKPVLVEPKQRDVTREWDGFVAYVKERKAWMAQTLRLCDNPHLEGEKLLIRFDNPSDCTLLTDRDNLQALTIYAQDFFQAELVLDVCALGGHCAEGDGSSPREERRALAADPLVELVTDIFDGKVVGIRTGPKFR
jgi:DNA polymerase-3 subunit gamma/tau